jgi:hypothetical protein
MLDVSGGAYMGVPDAHLGFGGSAHTQADRRRQHQRAHTEQASSLHD